MENEKIEIEEKKESKFDDLKPRTELAEMTKEEKEEIKREVLNQPEEIVEQQPDVNSDKKISKSVKTFGTIVTIIYTFFALGVGNICFLLVLSSILGGEFIYVILTIAIIIVVVLPYILLYKSRTRKKLYSYAIIYEIVLVIAAVIFFFGYMWPKIQSSINNQWCGIDGPCMRQD